MSARSGGRLPCLHCRRYTNRAGQVCEACSSPPCSRCGKPCRSLAAVPLCWACEEAALGCEICGVRRSGKRNNPLRCQVCDAATRYIPNPDDALTDGRWVHVRGGIQVWQADRKAS